MPETKSVWTHQRVAVLALAALTMALPWLRWDYGTGDARFIAPGALRETAAHLLAISVAILWLHRLLRYGDGGAGESLPRCFWLPLLFVTWAGLSWFWTADELATEMLLYTLLPWMLLVFMVAVLSRGAENRRLLVWCIVASGGLTGIVAIMARGYYPSPTGRLMFPYEHPAALGGALVFPVIGALVLATVAIRSKSFGRLGMSLLMLAPCLVALLYGRPRSSIAGILIGAAVGGALLLRGRVRRYVLLGWAIVGAVGMLVVADYYRLPENRESLYTSSFGTRVIFGATALRMAAARPVRGWGAGAFCRMAPGYENDADFLHGQRGDIVYTVHSEPLQVLAELGGIGLLLWLALHAVPLWKVARARWQEAKPDGYTVAILAGLIGMFIDSCGSMSLRYAELPWWYALGLGLALGLAPNPASAAVTASDLEKTSGEIGTTPSSIPHPIRFASWGVLVLVGAAWVLLVTLPGAGAVGDFNRGMNASRRGDTVLAAQASGAAAQRSRRLVQWWRAMQLAAELAPRNGELQRAVKLRRTVQAHFPADPINRQRLVRLLYRMGRTEEAWRICLDGLRLNPHDRRLDEWLGKISRSAELQQVKRWIRRLGGARSAADEAYLLLRTTWEAGDWTTAIAALEKIDTRKISLGEGTFILARWQQKWLANPAYHPLGGLSEAAFKQKREAIIRCLEPVIYQFPAPPRALALAAQILGVYGNDAERERAYGLIGRAVRLDRHDPAVIGVAAKMYTAAGDYAKASAVTAAAVSQDPEDVRLRVILIETLLKHGKGETARQRCIAAWRVAAFRHHPPLQRLAQRLIPKAKSGKDK